MIIENNNQSLIQHTGLGAKSKIFQKNDDAQSFSGSLESDEKLDEKGLSPLFPSARINNNINMIPQLGAGLKEQSIINGQSAETTEDIEAIHAAEMEKIQAKIETMNALLKKMGINGQVGTATMETVPQNYSMFYIETEDDAKNMVIMEFENGDLMYTETEQSSDDFFYSFDRAHTSLGLDNGKLSVAELKRKFAEYFGVDELKDFLLDLLDSRKKY